MFDSGAPGSPGASLAPLTVHEALADLDRYVSSPHNRFGTGWSVDDTCGMLGTGELALMWARSGSGKSTWMLNLVRATPQVPTLVVNMEMTARKQSEWLLPMTFDIETPAREIEDVLRQPDDPRFPEIREAMVAMDDAYPHLWFATPSRPTTTDLIILCDDIEDQFGVRPRRLFLDHIGLMAGAEEGYSGYVRNSAGLKALALGEDMAIYALQQTGRTGGDQGQKNDGHLPITFTSGVYGGEADADMVWGLYRPGRNPKYKKSRHDFSEDYQYWEMLSEYERVQHLVVMQVLKNRITGDTLEQGISLTYDPHSRRMIEGDNLA